MNRNYRVLSIMVGLLFCNNSLANEYSKIDIQWKGATAEDLQEQLKILTDQAKISVIYDGAAVLYYDKDLADVAIGMKSHYDDFPVGLKVVGMERIDGTIPASPVQEDKNVVVVKINPEKMTEMAVTTQEVAATVKELGDLSEAEKAKNFDKATITASGGQKVMLKDLASMHSITAKRPLIVLGKTQQEKAAQKK